MHAVNPDENQTCCKINNIRSNTGKSKNMSYLPIFVPLICDLSLSIHPECMAREKPPVRTELDSMRF